MKLAPLLAQYLYIHKQMDLPGLGTFQLDPAAISEPDNNKQSRPINMEGASFENNPSIKESPDLIQFISAQTGKIKALAAADLASHLGQALQFLNIGKPFLFEGIGNMVKLQSGEFVFTSGVAMPASMKDYSAKEISSTSSVEESFSGLSPKRLKTGWKKPMAVVLLLGGLAVAIWGGYTVYKRTIAKKKNTTTPVENKDESILVKDSVSQTKDSLVAPAQYAVVPAGNYKFILETADARRAFSRFSRLRTFQWAVQMETKDSALFTIFMLLPAADTTRVLDSLSRLNGKRVYIEQ